MARLARRLADAPTIRYDRRGYGRARTLLPGTLDQHVDDLVAIAGAGPVLLFGHSYGGLVALAAAASGSLDVVAVTTYEVPTPWIEGWPEWHIPDDLDAADVAEQFMRSTIGDHRWESLPARTRTDRRAEGRALLADMDAQLRAGPPFAASAVTVPCVLGTGTESLSSYRMAADWLEAQLPRAEHRRLPGADHGAPLTRPDDVAALVRRALAAGRSG